METFHCTEIVLSWWSSSSFRNNYRYLPAYVSISVAAVAAIGVYIEFFLFVWAVPKSAIKLHGTAAFCLVAIPQHPLLVPGSVRENLSLGAVRDIKDNTLISALERFKLWQRIREHGANNDSLHLSDGHQQLLCIARALLLPGGTVV
ncbi:hypothetical protein DL546_001847 [Coniochaeta pulveracea]|uniref:ABC transporter domain-containing protein n=1 Tax=Coniochaeta pulveracea TaxID=177199 RepID=A0A420YAG7_9PEZI|nr:hypothetical protein DL546_001847 [Coniochaeta pulveracea]